MKRNMSVKPVVVNDDILTPEEAGALFNVSKWAMYKRAKNGLAPAHYIGKRLYFLRSELISSTGES